MRTVKAIVLLFLLLFAVTSAAFADTSPETLISQAVDVVRNAAKQDDAESIGETLRGAYAIAIVPSMVKAGFLVGGEYGEGLILARKNGKWYGPSFYNISGGSFGLQIGVADISLLMAVKNQKGVTAFMKSRTKLGADVGVAAGPVGREAAAATDAQAKASIYSYSMSKGLFAGVALDGSVISVSVKRDEAYWGRKIAADDAMKKPADDKRIQPLLRELDALIKKAK